MYLSLITFFHISICVLLILIVLLQHGRGADMGATFGGGSNTLFGAGGADNLLTKVTTIMAGLFMLSSVFLSSGLKAGIVNNGALFESLPAETKSAPVPAPDTSNNEAPSAEPANSGAANTAASSNGDSPAVAVEGDVGSKNLAADIAPAEPVTAPVPAASVAAAAKDTGAEPAAKSETQSAAPAAVAKPEEPAKTGEKTKP